MQKTFVPVSVNSNIDLSKNTIRVKCVFYVVCKVHCAVVNTPRPELKGLVWFDCIGFIFSTFKTENKLACLKQAKKKTNRKKEGSYFIG